MIIQKQTSGDVWLVVNGINTKTLSEKCTMNLSFKKKGIELTDLQGQQVFIPLNQVQATQLLPAAALKFTGDLGDLWDLLVTDFFDELHIQSSGSSGITIENEQQVAGGTYNILPTDKNMVCTGNCTVVLPSVTTGKFAFRIWALAGTVVTVQCTGLETINGSASVQLYGEEMITVRNLLNLTDWKIGH